MTSLNMTAMLELTSLSRPALIATFSLYVLTLVVGVAGNAGIMHVILSHKSLRTGVNIYIVNMAALDLLSCALLVPLRMGFYLTKFNISQKWFVLCEAEVFFHSLVDTGRMLFLGAISFERYQAVANPFRRDKSAAARRAAITLALLWGVMLLHAVVLTVFLYDTIMFDFCLQQTSSLTKDYQLWGGIEIYFVLPLSLLTVLMVIVCYALMFRILHMQRNKMMTHFVTVVNKVAPAPASVSNYVFSSNSQLTRPDGGSMVPSGTNVTKVSSAIGNVLTSQPPGSSCLTSPETLGQRDSSLSRKTDATTLPITKTDLQLVTSTPREMARKNSANEHEKEQNTEMTASSTSNLGHRLQLSSEQQNSQFPSGLSVKPSIVNSNEMSNRSAVTAETDRPNNFPQKHDENINTPSDLSAVNYQPSPITSPHRADTVTRSDIDTTANTKIDSQCKVANTGAIKHPGILSREGPMLLQNSVSRSHESNPALSPPPEETESPPRGILVKQSNLMPLHNIMPSFMSGSSCSQEESFSSFTLSDFTDDIDESYASGNQTGSLSAVSDEDRKLRELSVIKEEEETSVLPGTNVQKDKIESSTTVNNYVHSSRGKTGSDEQKLASTNGSAMLEIVDIESQSQSTGTESKESHLLHQTFCSNNSPSIDRAQQSATAESSRHSKETSNPEKSLDSQASPSKSVGSPSPGVTWPEIVNNLLIKKSTARGSPVHGEQASVTADVSERPANPDTTTNTATSPRNLKTIKVVEMYGTVHMEKIEDKQSIHGDVCILTPGNRMQGRRRVEIKVAKRLVVIFLTFIFLWLPYPFAVLALRLLYMQPEQQDSPWQPGTLQTMKNVIAVLSALTTVTAAVNPIYYGVANVNIRNIVLTRLKKAFKCCTSRS